MADKFRQTFPIPLTFTDGELPTASKLQGLATQSRSGQSLIQYALGDIWGQSGDPILTNDTDYLNNALMVANIGRYLGPAHRLNPKVPELSNITAFTYTFTDDNGKYEAQLPFPPHATPGYAWSGGTGQSATPVADRASVDASGEWHISNTGMLYSFNPLVSTWTLTYRPIVSGNVDSEATWNIIPDPQTDSSWNYKGLKVEFKNGVNSNDGYFLYLPPRMPLYPAHPGDSDSRPAWYPQANNANMTNTPASVKTFWMRSDIAVPAPTGAEADHFRYLLPNCITSSVTGFVNGATLPAGLLYLWDPSYTGTILEDIPFAASNDTPPKKWKLYVPPGTGLDDWLNTSFGQLKYTEAMLQNTDHTYDLYPTGGLRLITIGADISKTVASLITWALNHDHSAPHSIASRAIEHSQLKGNFASYGTPLILDTGRYASGDSHPQYLERHGYDASRDNYANSFLGDLLIAAATPVGSNYLQNTNVANKIRFGSPTDGSYITQLAGGSLNLQSKVNLNLDAKTAGGSGDVNITAHDDINLTADDKILLSAASVEVVPAAQINSTLLLSGGAVEKTGAGNFVVKSSNAAAALQIRTSGSVDDPGLIAPDIHIASGRNMITRSVGSHFTWVGTGSNVMNKPPIYDAAKTATIACPLYLGGMKETAHAYYWMHILDGGFEGGCYSIDEDNSQELIAIVGSNWPDDCVVSNIQVNIKNKSASNMTVNTLVKKISYANPAWTWGEGRISASLGDSQTINAGLWGVVSVAISQNGTWSRQNDVITMQFNSNRDMAIQPIALVTCTFTKMIAYT